MNVDFNDSTHCLKIITLIFYSELPKILETINILFESMNKILWMSLKLLIFIKFCSLFRRKCSTFWNAFGNFYITNKLLGFLMMLQIFKPIMVQSMSTYFYKLNVGFAGPKKAPKRLNQFGLRLLFWFRVLFLFIN